MTGRCSFVPSLLRRPKAIAALAILFLFFGPGWLRAAGSAAERQRPLVSTHLSAPMNFEPNQGQADPAVQYVARGSGFAVFLAPAEIVLSLERRTSRDTLRMSLVGANPRANGVAKAPQAGVVSYLIGNDPSRWHAGIPTYGKVDYEQVYPGVDLRYYGKQRRLEYDFVIAPGADPSRIVWRIEGAGVRVDRKGNLILRAPNGTATFEKPLAYQMEGARRVPVQGAFAAAGNEVRFRLGNYDRSKALVIDPVLSYASYLAGTSTDYIGNITGPGIAQNGTSQGIAIDTSGSAYVTGYTTSTDFPVKSGYQGALPAKAGNWSSAFVTKFSADGSSLVYSTYLGGNGSDYGFAIAVDSSGEAYVAGMTNSVNFPVTSGAYQTACSPTPTNQGPPYAAACNSSNASAFVTKLNATGTGLIYSTFLGGYGSSNAVAIAVDAAGRAYVGGVETETCHSGYTFQGCFPTTGGAVIGGNQTGGGSPQYAYVAALDPTGAKLLYSTLFGDFNGFTCANGCGSTMATGVAVDANGYFYLIGNTQAGKLPTTSGVIQPVGAPLDSAKGVYLTAWRGFIAKFNPVANSGGSSLDWATYLGGHTGNTGDYFSGITVDSSNNVYVAGYTNSSDFPVTSGAYGTVCGTGGVCAAAHVTKLNSSGSSILWSTYVGGSRQDEGDSLFFTGPVQLDGKGNVYLMGQAGPNFPLMNPVEPAGNGGSLEVTVAELDPTGSSLLFSTRLGSGGLDTSSPGGLAVDAAGNIYVAGNNVGPDLVTTPGAFQTKSANSMCCYHGFVAKIAASSTPQITVTGTSVAVFNAATLQTGGVAPNEFITLKGTGLGPATGNSSSMTTQLAGSSVYINGTPAYLTYAQDGQINVLVPFQVSGLQNTTIQVEYNGVMGNTVTVPVTGSSPGIFTQSYGPGQAWMVNQDGTFNSASNAAARNSYVAFWLTGQGLVNTTVADGTQPSGPPYPAPMLPVGVSLGGVAVPAANIVFDGLVYSGELQMNLLIPANAPTGSSVPLVVTIGTVSSRSDATIAIR